MDAASHALLLLAVSRLKNPAADDQMRREAADAIIQCLQAYSARSQAQQTIQNIAVQNGQRLKIFLISCTYLLYFIFCSDARFPNPHVH
jgi:hypothetical protein